MDGLISDIRHGLRSLARTPTFTVVVILTLALGIGANAAIYSLLEAVVLRPLPYPEPDRLMILQEKEEGREAYSSSFSPADYLDLRKLSGSFEEVAAFRGLNYSLSGAEGGERVRIASVSPGFFGVFDVAPILGRSFLPEGDPTATGARVVVLSYGAWQNRFGGDRSILGRSIPLNGEPHEVIGVAPDYFAYPSNAEMWVRSYRDDVPEPPIDLGEDLGSVRDLGYITILGRLAAGVTFEQARAELETMPARLAEAAGDDRAVPLRMMALHDDLFGRYRPILVLLLGAVGLVLLIACANVANLLLARSRTRQREVAIRTALGAGRGRLIRQLFTENMIFGLLAGAAGLLLAVWGVDLLVRLAPPGIPRLDEVEVDAGVLLFTLVISVLTAALYGLLPAFRMSSPDLHLSLKDSGWAITEGRRGRRFRRGIVVSEIALSLLLLCAAGLLAKSLLRLLAVDPGFRPESLLVMRIDLSGDKLEEDARASAFVNEVVGRVRALPAVISAGTALALPFSGSAVTLNYSIEGQPATVDDDATIEFQAVSPGYFRTMGIPLISGRVLSEYDDADAPPVVVINEVMARRHWPGESPIGRRLAALGDGNLMEVVGVVGNVRHFALDRPPRPEIYTSYDQYAWPYLTLIVRTAADPLSLATTVREEIRAIDRDQVVHGIGTMEQVIADSTTTREFTVLLVSLFTVVALLLALLGIYAVISDSVNQRVREIGIRMTLGAQPGEVRSFVIWWGLRMVLEGTAIGILAALALTRFMSGMLYGTSAVDPLVFAGVAFLLAAAAVFATCLPAYRASRIDPVVLLRNE